MSACPDRLLLINGLIDNELDAANSLAIETHLKACSGCAEEFARLGALRAELGKPALRYAAAPSLHQRIADGLPAGGRTGRPVAHTRNGGRKAGWFAGGAAAALAASLALFLAVPQVTTASIQDEVVSSHVRSLLANHLMDVQTSNRHVVKPWFNGRIDFAPPVVDLADQGFPLAGGRIEYLEGHVVPALVYRRQLHVINVFIRPAGTMSSPRQMVSRHESYNLVRWTADGLEFWAVSDVEPADLKLFQRLFVARAGGNPTEAS